MIFLLLLNMPSTIKGAQKKVKDCLSNISPICYKKFRTTPERRICPNCTSHINHLNRTNSLENVNADKQYGNQIFKESW